MIIMTMLIIMTMMIIMAMIYLVSLPPKIHLDTHIVDSDGTNDSTNISDYIGNAENY